MWSPHSGVRTCPYANVCVKLVLMMFIDPPHSRSNISSNTSGYELGNVKVGPQLAPAQNTFDLGVCH